ncbi:MAG: tRNA (adenosine(37)-N6)-dimethylallyltransferase MiaA [Buchananella hordeovulneris]|nr:tRNA (adenosine(37)-N6)-dimethylallyltransferase MiaA [Buchananella hordeovulneris]
MIIAFVGPTASGKSDLALDVIEALAELRGVSAASLAQVVGADAMQLYRGMDVGTAKLPPSERRGITHHQIDVLDLDQEASVAAYQRHARADVAAIRAQGALPVVVGGSGLYIRALLDEIDFPGTDPAVRAELETEADVIGPRGLHQRLQELDPVAATQIEPGNVRRVVRALEVIALTGRPFSATMPAYTYHHEPTYQFQIDVPREELDRRIDHRSQAMFDAGLVEETRELLRRGLAHAPTAARATGYAQAMDVIAGRLTERDAVDAVARATRQLARKQLKWFRRDPRIHLLPWEGGVDAVACARHIDALLPAKA